MALAQFAGQTVAGAAITDVWEAVRGRFARLLGRGNARKTQVAEQWLAQTHEQLTAATAGSGLEQVLLYTDLANPTSNALYQRIGYSPVEDRLVLSFDHRVSP
jgi:hypothetical protein